MIALLIILAVMVIQSGAAMSWWLLTFNPFDYLPGPCDFLRGAV